MKIAKSIKNWSHFGVDNCIIELWQVYDEDTGETVRFESFLTIWLDDGLVDPSDIEKAKVISLHTSIDHEDALECAKETAVLAVNLFGTVSKIVHIIREGNVIDKLEISNDDFIGYNKYGISVTDDNDVEEEEEIVEHLSYKSAMEESEHKTVIPVHRTLH